MHRFALGFLLALSVSSIAVTDNPDGSITFTADEASAMRKNVKDATEEMQRLESEVERANKIFPALLKRIRELEQEKCI